MKVLNSAFIDTESFSEHLRGRGIDLAKKRVLMTKFAGSKQASDLTLPPNCAGFGRIHHFYRDQGPGWPSNPLPIDVAARFFETERPEMMLAQVFQNAICSWRCWYCYVDYDLLSGNRLHSEFVRAADLLDLYQRNSAPPPLIDLSGGQPDLVPEWTLWMADELRERGLDQHTFLWSDDNLSNDYLWRFLTTSEVSRLASYRNYARVGCFKGFDEESFSFNTTAKPDLFLQQFRIMRRLIETGFDVYGYVTMTSPEQTSLRSRVRAFVDLLQEEVHPLFPLRVVPLRIRSFTPTRDRICDDQRRAMEVQFEAVAIFQEELEKRFDAQERGKPIYAHPLL